jgi:hypothetical protein
MSSSVSPIRPSQHAPPRSKRTSTRRSTRSPSPLQPNNGMVMPPSVSQKLEPSGKPVTRRRTPANKRKVATNGSTATAKDHDTSTTVQLQDIHEQQDPIIVVGDESAPQPNGHADAAELVQILITPVVPKVADRSGEAVKKIDWEIPRKTLHSSIGSCLPTVPLVGPC